MRTRSKTDRDEHDDVTTHETYYRDFGNGWELQSERDYNATYSSDYSAQTTIDVVTPDYRKRIARGDIINNPFQSYKTEITALAGNMELSIGDTGGNSRWDYSGPNQFAMNRISDGSSPLFLAKPEIDTETLDSQAVTDAWANIQLSECNVLENVAEIDKSISSIISILYRVFKIARSIRKLDLKALREEVSVHELEDRYMEARYAIRPLMIEADNALKIAAGYTEKPVDRRTFRAKSSDSARDDASGIIYSDGGPNVYTGTRSILRTYEARAGVLTRINSVNPLNLIGLDSVIETAWELVPFSFIVDWFLNVGQIIASHTPESGVTTLASWVVSRDVVVSTINVTGWECTGSYQCYSFSGTDTFIRKTESTVIRTVSPTRAWLPTLKVSLNPLKLLDLGVIIKRLFSVR